MSTKVGQVVSTPWPAKLRSEIADDATSIKVLVSSGGVELLAQPCSLTLDDAAELARLLTVAIDGAAEIQLRGSAQSPHSKQPLRPIGDNSVIDGTCGKDVRRPCCGSYVGRCDKAIDHPGECGKRERPLPRAPT